MAQTSLSGTRLPDDLSQSRPRLCQPAPGPAILRAIAGCRPPPGELIRRSVEASIYKSSAKASLATLAVLTRRSSALALWSKLRQKRQEEQKTSTFSAPGLKFALLPDGARLSEARAFRPHAPTNGSAMEQQAHTSERWRQVKEIFHAAVKLPASERKAYLTGVCAGDPSLLTEVESLLVAHEEPGSFLDTPAFNFAEDPAGAALLGKSLGRYRILSLLGRGGMGEVYKAKDATLGRDVAVKVLPSGFSIDRYRLRRFEQEARAASALNHPNIITIHEFGLEEGVHFIVSEFI